VKVDELRHGVTPVEAPGIGVDAETAQFGQVRAALLDLFFE
jgi:hypothetical protein